MLAEFAGHEPHPVVDAPVANLAPVKPLDWRVGERIAGATHDRDVGANGARGAPSRPDLGRLVVIAIGHDEATDLELLAVREPKRDRVGVVDRGRSGTVEAAVDEAHGEVRREQHPPRPGGGMGTMANGVSGRRTGGEDDPHDDRRDQEHPHGYRTDARMTETSFAALCASLPGSDPAASASTTANGATRRHRGPD